MKTKPVLIILSCVVVLLCGFLFIRSRNTAKPEKGEIVIWLNKFNTEIATGQTDSLLSDFENGKNQKIVKRLINVLINKSSISGRAQPIFKLSLHTDSSEIKFVNSELVSIKIPTVFSNDKSAEMHSFLLLTVHKIAKGVFKIIRYNGRELWKDYAVYDSKIRNIENPKPDSLLFGKVTLAAFKTAKTLKARYDSVLYFEHINNKTYYFVARGSFPKRYNDSNYHYTVGLLNPELKEIIPVKYDLIHNIGGTVEGLIEVNEGNKKGFFDISGKLIVPVEYDQILPLTDTVHLALLNKGNDYFYLKKDLSISERLRDFKIADEFKKIRNYDQSFMITEDSSNNFMEYNSRDDYNSIIIPPSYLVDWNILSKILDLPNRSRNIKDIENEIGEEEGSEWFKVNFNGHQAVTNSWFENIYYSIVDNYVGSRGGLYNTKSMLMIDKKNNRIMGLNVNIDYITEREGGAQFSGLCNENYMRQLNDTLFELKTTADIEIFLPDSLRMTEAPYYHYLRIKGYKLEALPNRRFFSFTKYVKLDDSYLSGCYVVQGKSVDHLTKQMLQYAKNEIFAEYHYQFKNPMWTDFFAERFDRDEKTNRANVDDSLTEIDKYNINWINNKLKGQKGNTLAAK